MPTDVWLAVAQGVIVLLLGGIGFHLTMYAADTPRKKRANYLAFVVLSLFGLVLIGIQAQRTSEAQQQVVGGLDRAIRVASDANANSRELRAEVPKQIAASVDQIKK